MWERLSTCRTFVFVVWTVDSGTHSCTTNKHVNSQRSLVSTVTALCSIFPSILPYFLLEVKLVLEKVGLFLLLVPSILTPCRKVLRCTHFPHLASNICTDTYNNRSHCWTTHQTSLIQSTNSHHGQEKDHHPRWLFAPSTGGVVDRWLILSCVRLVGSARKMWGNPQLYLCIAAIFLYTTILHK